MVGCKICTMRVVGTEYLVALMLFALSLPVGAQQNKMLTREAIDSLLNPALHPNAANILSFEKVKKNIGTIYESDAARTIKFAFCNVSDKAVAITKVITHCGCTASAFTTSSIAPGDSSVVAVTYNPKGRSGTIDTDAFVYTNSSGSSPVARLTILGNVVDIDEWNHLPCVAGVLRFKRKQAIFNAGRSEVRIPCANIGTSPLELHTLPLPQYVTFATEPQVLQPGEEGDMVITIDTSRIAGEQEFRVILDGVGGEISSRTIKAIIEQTKE